MKKIAKVDWFLIASIVVFFGTGLAFYPSLPDQVISHWNASGMANGYISRFWGAFLLPVIFILLVLLFWAIPRIDPRRENILKFKKYYDHFLIAFTVFFYLLYLATLLVNIGYSLNISFVVIPLLAGLFYVIGEMLPHTKQNYLIGIRTPWTLASEVVWEKTHYVGGIAFRIVAIIGLVGIFFPLRISFWFLLAPIIVAAIGLFIYSYVLYRKEKQW